mgnify:CR=1 FL=1
MTTGNSLISTKNVDVYYGDNHAIKSVTLDINRNEVVALIGPSGCGKSTFIRCLNRMNDIIESAKVSGLIELDGEDIYSKNMLHFFNVADQVRVGAATNSVRIALKWIELEDNEC